MQVCFCFTQSVASTRWMIQDEQRIQNTKCDNCLIGEHCHQYHTLHVPVLPTVPLNGQAGKCLPPLPISSDSSSLQESSGTACMLSTSLD